jgi:hypothetical protein
MAFDRFAHTIVIDDRGEEEPWPSARILKDIDPAHADFDAVDFAVRNLGYVLIVDRPDFVRVRLRPLLTSSRAVAALYFYLAERSPPRAAIAWFDDAWHDEVCGNAKALIARLTSLLHGSTRVPVPEPHIATRRSLDTVLNPDGHPFAPLLRAWLKGSRDELQAVAREYGLWDRANIAERDPDRGDFFFRHVGKAIQVYSPEWGTRAVGRRLSEQPDSAYGRWIEAGCAAADDSRMARCELVHASVAWRGGEVRRWRYERLMLPFEAADGRRMVMSISARDPGPGR